MRNQFYYPKRIYLELTNACNLSCPFCPKSNRPISYLALADVEKVMIESRGICEYFYFHVQGEPLLYPELEAVLILAEKQQRKIQLVTNGVLLQEKGDLLLQAQALRKISISLQGLFLAEAVEEKTKQMVDFISAAKQRNDLIVEIRLWDSEDQTISDFIKRQWNIEKIETGDVKIRERLYLSFKKRFDWPGVHQGSVRTVANCIGPRLMLAILSDGTITPCCLDIEGKLDLGNIKDVSLEEALRNPRRLAIIQGFQDNKVLELLCNNCDYGEK